MNLNFNLNPDAYTFLELSNLLSLKKNYNDKDVIVGKKKILSQLQKNNSLGMEERRNIAFFIDTISNKLIANINKDKSSKAGTWAEKTVPVEQYDSNILITNPNIQPGLEANISDGRITSTGIDVPPGYINPINVKTISQAVNIDSRFRQEYYKTKSTDFSVTLTEPQRKVVSMHVGALEIPTCWYAVSQSLENNCFLIIENNRIKKNPCSAWLVTMPDGNYEAWWIGASCAASVIQSVNQSIELAQPGTIDEDGRFTPSSGDTLSVTKDIAYTLDHRNGKSVFATPAGANTTNDNDGGKNYSIRFNIDSAGNLDMNVNIQLRFGWMLGFRAAQYNITLSDGKGIGAVSEAPCYITRARYGFLSINDYQNNSTIPFIMNYTDSSSDIHVISRINLASIQSDYEAYQSADNPGVGDSTNITREYFGPVDIQRLDIKILDEYGRILDLVNMDWSLTLIFSKLYD
jgi:hypothetical protein